MHSSRTPTLHMRTYPSWALPASDVLEKLKNLPDEICSEALAHICQYLNYGLLKEFCEKLFPNDNINSIDDLCALCLRMDKLIVRKFMAHIFNFAPRGKCLEALCIFKFGIEMDGAKYLKLSTGQKNSTPPQEQAPIDAICMNMHNYCTEAGSVSDHTYHDAAHTTEDPDSQLRRAWRLIRMIMNRF